MAKNKRNHKRELYINNLLKQSASVSDSKLLKFSFKYFRSGVRQGESFEEWEKDQILADLNNKLKLYSQKIMVELLNDRTLELFDNFPIDSGFDIPNDLADLDIRWARMRVTGQRRLIGFFWNDIPEFRDVVFNIVYLDKKHCFAPSYKQHT